MIVKDLQAALITEAAWLESGETYAQTRCPILRSALDSILGFLTGWPLAICGECGVEPYCPEEFTECTACGDQNAELDREEERDREYQEGLADLADSLGDAVRCGDRSMASAAAAYAAAARRRR